MSASAVTPEVLQSTRNAGYGRQPLPSGRDREIRALVEASSAEELRQSVLPDSVPVLRVFAERAASLAVRDGDQRLLRTGLVSLVVSGLSSREALLLLPLYCDAARRLHVDEKILFGTVGNLFGEPEASQLTAFLGRSSQDRSLSSMGYTTETGETGFRYVRTW